MITWYQTFGCENVLRDVLRLKHRQYTPLMILEAADSLSDRCQTYTFNSLVCNSGGVINLQAIKVPLMSFELLPNMYKLKCHHKMTSTRFTAIEWWPRRKKINLFRGVRRSSPLPNQLNAASLHFGVVRRVVPRHQALEELIGHWATIRSCANQRILRRCRAP